MVISSPAPRFLRKSNVEVIDMQVLQPTGHLQVPIHSCTLDHNDLGFRVKCALNFCKLRRMAPVYLCPSTVVLVCRVAELFQFIGAFALHQYGGLFKLNRRNSRSTHPHLGLFYPPNASNPYVTASVLASAVFSSLDG